MRSYSLFHLADHDLVRGAHERIANACTAIAELIAYLAEIDARKLYLPAAYPSMFHYCIGEFHLSEDAAAKRIQAARAARAFPALFEALADGRLHLSGVGLLAPHLSPGTVDELISAAAGKTCAEIRTMLAARFPRPDVATRLVPMPPVAHAGPVSGSHATKHVNAEPAARPESGLFCATAEPSGGPNEASGPVKPEVPQPAADAPRARVAPLSPERFALQVTIGRDTHDLLRYAQALMSHAVPAQDVAQVLDRALKALVERLERRRFAACARTRPRRGSANTRYVPAEIRRAVWQRDQGRCTFVSRGGRRCDCCARLEFDHVIPVARGGRTTLEGLRLRCRAHNQYEADQVFGTEFMRRKREASRHVQNSGPFKEGQSARVV